MFVKILKIVRATMRSSLRLAVTGTVLMSSGIAMGETFAWKYEKASGSTPAASPDWRSFGTAANWAIGTDKTGSNPNGLIPGIGDYIYYGASAPGTQAFDLDDTTYKVGGIVNGMNHWSAHLFLVRNGTLEFMNSFTNRGAHVYVYDTGRFVLGSGCGTLCGQSSLGGLCRVYSGGEAVYGGSLAMHLLYVTIDDGGTLTFNPSEFKYYNTANAGNGPSYIRNSGSLAIPQGVTLGGKSGVAPCVFVLEQKGGTLTLGGNVKMTDTSDRFDFVLAGGTLHATNDVTFIGLRSVMMTNDATATVEVDAAKTLYCTNMVFASGTSLTKNGAGTLRIGASAPDALAVSAGVLEVCGAATFGEGLSLASGTTLHIAAIGVSADSITGLADASVTIDASVFGGGSPVFRSCDPSILAAIRTKLGEAPAGFSYSISGNALFLFKEHDPAIFSWRFETGNSGAAIPASPNWQSFGSPASWAVGTSKSGSNPDSLIPGADDEIYYGASANDIQCFDLDGVSYTVKGVNGGDTKWNEHLMLFRNGSLTFSGSFTNYGAHVHVYDAGKFVLGPACGTVSGRGGTSSVWHTYDGGEMDIGGEYVVNLAHVTVDAGGKMTFRPTTFAFHNTANKGNGPSYIRNNGTLDVPGDLNLSGRSGAAPCVFSIEQCNGTMTLGGNLSSTASADYADFILSGGTINATNDVAFSGFRTILMTNDAVAVANVSASKTLDLTKMAFESGTSLTKTGEGTLKLKVSVPAYMAVSAGTLEVTGAASFVNGITLAPGATLRIAVAGVSAASVTGIADANIVFDESLFTGVTPLFVSPDAATLSAIREKLGTAPEGCTYRIDGDTLVLDKPHEASLFYWKKEGSAAYYSFYDPSCWGIGDTADATNPNDLIPGEDDEIYYGNVYSRYMYFDMKGTTRTVKALSRGMGPNNSPYGMFYMNITNGTLAFTSCFTNFRAYVTSEAGGRFVLGEDCFTKAGSGGAANRYIVKAGGECDLGGTIDVNVFQSTVSEDGRLIFRPKVFRFENLANSSYASSFISNSGVLEMPNGFTMGGKSGVAPCLFVINQNGGTLTLGGDLTMTDTADYADFVLAGGTVNATNDVSFNGFHTVMMTNDATAVVCVADGKTLDFSVMSFESGTALSKTGGGTLKIGASVPDAIAVDTGILSVSGAAAFGEGLSLGSGSTLHFAAGGTTAGAIAGIEDASVTFDAKSVGYGSAILTSTNETLIATVADKMAPAIAAADKPKLFLVTEVSVGDPAVRQLRLMRIPKGAVLSFR